MTSLLQKLIVSGALREMSTNEPGRCPYCSELLTDISDDEEIECDRCERVFCNGCANATFRLDDGDYDYCVSFCRECVNMFRQASEPQS